MKGTKNMKGSVDGSSLSFGLVSAQRCQRREEQREEDREENREENREKNREEQRGEAWDSVVVGFSVAPVISR